MAECSHQLEGLKLLDASCAMGGSDELEYVTASASEAHYATMSPSFLSAQNESLLGTEMTGECSNSMSVEQQIERSKVHWSTLVDQSECSDEDEDCVAEVSNVKEFMELQAHPTWGSFFQTFGYSLKERESMGELVVGEKFAEGGQAELFHAEFKWCNPETNERLMKEGVEYVLKVFKKGTFLKHLKMQLPRGFLQVHAWRMENLKTMNLFPRFECNVYRGTLLKDGRFAFLMQKEYGDLHQLIECNMALKLGKDGGPFSKEEAEFIMYRVALGMDWLHRHNIIHRDLKAANVLVRKFEGYYPRWVCFVADYECSVGVVGTGFYRAPEILRACKERRISQSKEVFSGGGDIYSYGMTCYEVLTGKVPFENHPLKENCSMLIDLIINQNLRPEVPNYVDEWARELLSRCWQSNPISRPAFREILNLLSEHSPTVRDYKELLTSDHDEFRVA
ncbi:hypothetical protein KC19_10G079900 [Ceratodon purpureus]|uniref:Protein kinase domain-containing protein n=1 Tax=Ceratodon purpureus TaxID=3225 RepID=A0A8T0GLI1_CERPU|nr:hypothetical protein KC19_10G079900 [Ceratodon purpureus]